MALNLFKSKWFIKEKYENTLQIHKENGKKMRVNFAPLNSIIFVCVLTLSQWQIQQSDFPSGEKKNDATLDYCTVAESQCNFSCGEKKVSFL